jgi:hypothetical protein
MEIVLEQMNNGERVSKLDLPTKIEYKKFMSTKATIAYGKDFHLYEEMGDQNHIYIELETNNYEARYGRVMLPIPVHIWEAIREFPGVRFELAGLSDAKLQQRVEREVDERIAKWREAKKRGEKSVWRWVGALAFGDADDSRAKQIKKGLAYYRQQRKWEREVKEAIAKLRWENSPEGRRKRNEEHDRKAARHQAARKVAETRKKAKVL